MSCRDIFCVLESEKGALTPAFHQALALATLSKAHLTVVVASRRVSPPVASLGGTLVSGAIATANAGVREIADAAANKARDAIRTSGVIHEIIVREGMLGEIADWAGQRARIADVTLLDRTAGAIELAEAVFEETLFYSGRPVIVASDKKISERVERLCVAWNGTAVAARALGDALGLFPGIKKVDIVCVTAKKNASGRVPGVDAAQHVARHGIDANVVDISMSQASVAGTLDDYARTSGADLIVMGGFGHSRLREFIWGGVTRELSATTSVPLLLSH